MICFGNVPASSVLPIFFDSFAGSTGASVTLTGLAATDIEVYKGTSMTQRASDAGYTLLDTDGIDVDGVTGIHGFSIDLGDNTDASFYAVGSFFTVVVSAVTIDSQTVNFVAATFRIVAAEGTAGTPVADATRWNNLATVALPLIPTTAGRTLDVSAGGEAGVDWANVGSPTTTVGLSGTTVKTATDVETDTADIQSRLPAALTGAGNMKTDALAMGGATVTAEGAGVSVPTTLASRTNITGGTITTTTNVTNGVTLAASAVQAIWDAAVSALTTVGSIGKRIVDYLTGAVALDSTVAKASNLATLQTSVDDLPTNAELATALGTADDAVLAAIAALNNLSAAAVNAEVVDVLRTDAGTEVSSVPSATATIAAQIQYLFQALRNQVDITATAKKVHTTAGAVVSTKTLSDDGTTYSEAKAV